MYVYQAKWSSMSVTNKFDDLPDLPKLTDPHQEWCYFVEAASDPILIKIGHSHNLKWRLSTLQAASPVQLKLIGAVLGPAGTEFAFHHIFGNCRSHGEWFYPTQELLAVVKSLPKGGKVNGIDLIQIAKTMNVSIEEIKHRLWNGTRRRGRKYFRAKKPMPRRKLGQEQAIIEGARWISDWNLRPSIRKRLKEIL